MSWFSVFHNPRYFDLFSRNIYVSNIKTQFRAMSKRVHGDKSNLTLRKRNKESTTPSEKQFVSEKMSDTKSTVTSQSNAGKYNFKYLETPAKAANDLKEYKVIQLENGLKALLISDAANLQDITQCLDELTESDDEADEAPSSCGCAEESGTESDSGAETDESGSVPEGNAPGGKEEKMAAVGLSVGVGSFSDPEKIPGLAHFLEHMVFMGSKKYPRENDFDNFITLQAGFDSAHTNCETTTFYFECLEKHLQLGMDKFVQFFTEPLMKVEAMTRERQAVEAEFQESCLSDYHRVVQLLCGVARDKHPAGKFTWGNAATLRDACTDEELHCALHAFRSRHYSAHRITVAVQARLPMNELEKFVSETFSSVKNNSLPPDDFSAFRDSFDTPDFRRLYRVKSIKDRLSLQLNWTSPPCTHLYRCRPYFYLQHLLNNEAEGSLLHHLRQQLWALSLSVCPGDMDFTDNAMYFMFTITVELTDQGYQHLDKVIGAVFTHLRTLRTAGVKEWIYREMQAIQRLAFDNGDEQEAIKNVEDYSEGLQYYQPAHCITAHSLVDEYRPELIVELQGKLTPDKVNIVVSSLDSTINYDKREKWFKTEYTVSDTPEAWRKSWRSVSSAPWSALPAPNVFLPTDLSLLEPPDDQATDLPQLIATTELAEVWYKQDVKFKLPMAYYYFHLVSPIICSARDAVLRDLYVDLLEQELAAPLYAARAAAADYTISPAMHGLTFKVSGFCEKLPIVVETIVQKMSTFKTSPGLFNVVKTDRIKAYYNASIKPKKLNSEMRLKVLLNRHYTCLEKQAAAAAVTAADLDDFKARFHGRLHLQALVQGNVTKQLAVKVAMAVAQGLGYKAVEETDMPKVQVRKLNLDESRTLRAESLNTADSNSVITNYYQSGLGTVRSVCVAEYIMGKMSEPLFDQLRTKQQLGYDVNCEMRDTHGVIGFTVTVHYQESSFSAEDVDKRIEEFLESFKAKTRAMSEKAFDDYRVTVIKSKKCADVHLKEEVDRNWAEITNMEYLFDRRQKEIAILEVMTLEEVQTWLSKHLSSSSGENFRKLSIQVVGSSEKKDIDKDGTTRVKRAVPSDPKDILDAKQPQLKLLKVDNDNSFVSDIEQYRTSLPLLPSHIIIS